MVPPVRPCRQWQLPAVLLLLLATLPAGCRTAGLPAPHAHNGATAASPFVPDEARMAGAPATLRERLQSSPIALFRFVNEAWTREACAALGDEVAALPTARLHGDAHVEQYAVTADARGLDDFDDSARGPAAIDILRFLGSLELTARARGWDAALPSIVDGFFEGYRRALEDPAYLPPDPSVVARLRAMPAMSQDEFLAWAESLMQPMSVEERAKLDLAWGQLKVYVANADPEITPAFLRRKKAGWLRMGIGSALTRKILFRVEGPTPSPGDDAVFEAKEVTPLAGVPCLSVPRTGEAFRAVEGIAQIGRIRHRLLVALPSLPDLAPEGHGWWLRAWDRTYREVEIDDLASPDELRELAHDVGAQLGSTNLVDSPADLRARARQAELEGLTRLEPRLRELAHALSVEVVDAWERFRRASPATGAGSR
ncbi:MAG: DUF2252 family protein [Vicinamibacterales bacterium]|nr:DUF2252 family protein [Vicinamibacterales bacterium]